VLPNEMESWDSHLCKPEEELGLSPCRTRWRGGIVTLVDQGKRQDFTLQNQLKSAGLTQHPMSDNRTVKQKKKRIRGII
jgi:hypothetical protein